MPDGLRFDPDVAYSGWWRRWELQVLCALATPALVQRLFFLGLADSSFSCQLLLTLVTGGCPRRVK